MKAEEFVKKHYPDAVAKRKKASYSYWHIVLNAGTREEKSIGGGDRESWAWAAVKRNIEKLIAAQENPVDDGEHY